MVKNVSTNIIFKTIIDIYLQNYGSSGLSNVQIL